MHYVLSGGYEVHSSLPINYTNTPAILLQVYSGSKNQRQGTRSSQDIYRLWVISEGLRDFITINVEWTTFIALLG
jgi:hypothetical protein